MSWIVSHVILLHTMRSGHRNKSQVNSFLKHAFKYGLCSGLYTIDADIDLFCKMARSKHCAHSLLPLVKSCTLYLTPKGNIHELPRCDSEVYKKSFVPCLFWYVQHLCFVWYLCFYIWLPWSAWLSGRTSVSGQRSFAASCARPVADGWPLTMYVGKPSDIGQSTRPTQPFRVDKWVVGCN